MAEAPVKIHRIYPGAIPPMRADASALGTLPAAAFQYCEAIRSASAFGWYVFPAADLQLRWDGAEAWILEPDGDWRVLTSAFLEDEFYDDWDRHAPDDHKGLRIPHVSTLFVPGIVQIWTGLLVSTQPDWSVLIRPLANLSGSHAWLAYEGLVETDLFAPCPLFINLRLLSTSGVISIPKRRPLFQLQPVRRECYADTTMALSEALGTGPGSPEQPGMSAADWDGVRRTVRSVQSVREAGEFGRYGARVRRRRKQDDPPSSDHR